MPNSEEPIGTMKFVLEAGRILGIQTHIESACFLAGADLEIVKHTKGWISETLMCVATGTRSQLAEVKKTIESLEVVSG